MLEHIRTATFGASHLGSRDIAVVVALLAAACSSDSKSTRNGPDSGATEAGAGGAGGAGGASAGAGGASAGAGGTDAGATDGGPRFDVTTKSGVVEGKLDGSTRVFYGIPYAAPPTGANRFRPPQPVAAWSTTRDATQPGKVCPQITAGGTTVDARSDEDCLLLNVFTPDPPPSTPLPVMVWIHGGAFVFGSGGESYYDGARLVEEGHVVVVSINYRLGALGFLAHPALTAESSDHPTSGNYGFEDQQAALRWVKDNIAAFGGDPAQVTIWGESAGGYSVCAHLVAPDSAGLFQRAISESGLCSGHIGTTRDAQYANGEALAAAVGCTDPTHVIECLRAKTPEDFLQVSSGAPPLPGGLFFQGPRSAADGGAAVSTAFSPVTDGVIIPVDIAAVGSGFAKVPLLLGTNQNEGTLFTAPGLFGGTPVSDDASYQAALERSFGATVAANVLAQYPSSAFATPNDALNEVATDAFFVCPARKLARDASSAGADVYLYAFAHVPEKPLLPNLGVFHASELGYVFGTAAPLAPPQADEEPLGATIRGYWTRFAHGSDPNGGGAPAWPKFTTAGDQDLKLDLPAPSAEVGHKKAKCDFWDSAL
jgi:para-nitrobenzyl esterase